MIMKAFSIRDLKAETFNPPFFAPSLGEGERTFVKIARDPQSNVNQFPEDFQLYYVGDYETDSSQYTALTNPQHLSNATAAKQLNLN